MKRFLKITIGIIIIGLLGSCSSSKSKTLDESPVITEEPTIEEEITEEEPTTEKETMVYITKTGSKYHKVSCSSLSDSCIEISLDEAEAKGYTPCERCY